MSFHDLVWVTVKPSLQLRELPLMAEGVEKVGTRADLWCPLLVAADVFLAPQILLRRFGVIGLWV